MIKLILFLASLEQKVKESKIIEADFKKLQKEKSEYGAKLPSPTTAGKIKAGFYNVGKIVHNAYDNTIGYAVAKGQNRGTREFYIKNPASKDKIVYLMHGVFQNEGSQAKLGKQLKKGGYNPYHLKGKHHLKRKENAEQAFEQIDEFQKDTKLKNPSKRSDIYSGQSSGADVGIYMAGDKRIIKYGIRKVQARAPAPTGVKPKTLGQRLLIPLVPEDSLKGDMGKRNAVELNRRKPKVPVYVVSGKYDNLVPPSDAVYKHAKKHHIIDDKDSTHFGTAGGNKKMNDIIIDLMKNPNKKYKRAA